jgi:hypothetical protein
VPLPNSPEDLREALTRIQTEPEWQLLWEHLLAARQDSLLRMASCLTWDQFLELRGEFNALNIVIEFGDVLLSRLEESMQHVGDKDGGPRGREAGYNGRTNGEG